VARKKSREALGAEGDRGMNGLRRAAVLLELRDQLSDRGSWCGETHLQKATYFLQELLKVPMDFEFILYKHGPFSFELRDELTAMRADGLIEIRSQRPYGPALVTTDAGRELKSEYPRTLERYGDAINFVARRLGSKNVSQLERLATALFITVADDSKSPEERAEEVSELKPHIDLESAEAAVDEVDDMIRKANRP